MPIVDKKFSWNWSSVYLNMRQVFPTPFVEWINKCSIKKTTLSIIYLNLLALKFSVRHYMDWEPVVYLASLMRGNQNENQLPVLVVVLMWHHRRNTTSLNFTLEVWCNCQANKQCCQNEKKWNAATPKPLQQSVQFANYSVNTVFAQILWFI